MMTIPNWIKCIGTNLGLINTSVDETNPVCVPIGRQADWAHVPRLCKESTQPSSPSPATVIEKKIDPPVQRDSEKDVEDKQPEENVSRLHETVIQNPKPVFRGYPKDDEDLDSDD